MTKYPNAYAIVIISSLIFCLCHGVIEKGQSEKFNFALAAVKILQIFAETCDFGGSVNVVTNRPTDCTDLKKQGKTTGVYMIYPARSEGFKVFCDMDIMDKGWTVFQNRFDGKVDFYRTWNDYKHGFASLNGEFWLGNEHIHKITYQGRYILRIVLEDFEKIIRYAEYETFYLDDGDNGYKLHISGYHGNAADSLADHNNQMFTTKDKDNDVYSGGHCSQMYKGAWWYSACHTSNLNGLYLNGKNRSVC